MLPGTQWSPCCSADSLYHNRQLANPDCKDRSNNLPRTRNRAEQFLVDLEDGADCAEEGSHDLSVLLGCVTPKAHC